LPIKVNESQGHSVVKGLKTSPVKNDGNLSERPGLSASGHTQSRFWKDFDIAQDEEIAYSSKFSNFDILRKKNESGLPHKTGLKHEDKSNLRLVFKSEDRIDDN
jgi:hypothetical protein